MAVIAVAVILTVLALYFLICMGGSRQELIVEIVIAKAWQNRFAKIDLLEKCRNYIRRNEKYHIYSEKKLKRRRKKTRNRLRLMQKRRRLICQEKQSASWIYCRWSGIVSARWRDWTRKAIC